MVSPPTRTISNLPRSNSRVSSGCSKRFRITSYIEPSRRRSPEGYSKKLRSRPLFSLRQTRKKTATTSSTVIRISVRTSSALSASAFKVSPFRLPARRRSRGLPLARRLGRLGGRRRVTHASYAPPLDLLDEEGAALVPDLLAGKQDAAGAREQEARQRRV